MNGIEQRSRFDFTIFFMSIILWGIGIILVYSATTIHESGPLASLYKQQIIWVLMGIVIILVIISIPGKLFYNFAYILYGLSLLLLLFALVKGFSAKGAERWISIFGIKLQPSEFAKIGLLLALSRYFSERNISLYRLSSFVIPGLLIVVPFLLVLKQPDLGTAGVLCVISLPIFFWSGLSLLELFFLLSPIISLVLSAIPLILTFETTSGWGFNEAIPWGIFFIIVCGILYLTRPSLLITIFVIISNLFTATITTVVWNSFLKDYQKLRIISFINPQADPFGAGYQVIQSKVAIGSGHIFGKGFLKGTQTRLSYLPEQHTDFIFSVLGEQFGFVGCVIILLLLFLLIVKAISLIYNIKNRFFNLIIISSVSVIGFHLFINCAMTIGIMPVTGIPFPFLSYGGSFTITLSILIGLILNSNIYAGK